MKTLMEHFDDDVCDLFNSYLGEDFVSSNNKQFFNDFKFQIENKQKYVSKQIFVTRRFLH